jgi:DNA repair exonuclease SbcCD nuclease subunit
MRFTVFSDLHLHEWSYGSTLTHGKNSRLEQQKEVVKAIVRYNRENDIDLTFFCGDLFHSHTVTAPVSQAAWESFHEFKRAGQTLKLSVGNHDQMDRRGEIHALEFFRSLGTVYDIGILGGNPTELLHESILRGTERFAFTCLPYTESKEQLEAWLSKVNEGCLFLHQGVGGVEVNSKGFTLNEILTPEMINPNVSMAFAGHYHSFNQVSYNLMIPGSTMQLNWGDQGEPRGWLDVTADKGQVTDVRLIQSPASRFVTVNEDNLALADDIVGNFVRVVSKGNYSPEELSSAIMGRGAASCEVKVIRGENKPVTVKPQNMASFNEVVYSFGAAKEALGVIDEYDRAIGDRLLKENYSVPEV